VHGVQGELLCLELASGRVVWQRNTSAEWDVPQDFFGVVATPLVRGEHLIVSLGAPKGPSVIALDRRTGKLAWASDGPAWGASCASPVLATLGGRERLLVLAGGDSRPPTGGLLVLDPASGKLQHSYPFRSRTYESVLAANPLALGERIFVSSSYNTGSAVLEAKPDGTFSELWTDRHLGLQFSNPLALDGKIILIDGVHDRAGALVVLDPANGKTLARTELVWDEELERNGKKSTVAFTPGEGSLLAVGERLLCLGDSGHLLALAITPAGATITSRAWLFRANEAWTPPVVSHGLLYVVQTRAERGGGRGPRLLCYDLRGE
jgi:outer membrane protein assembly factor BamB